MAQGTNELKIESRNNRISNFNRNRPVESRRDDYTVAMGVNPWNKRFKHSSSVGATDLGLISRSYGA